MRFRMGICHFSHPDERTKSMQADIQKASIWKRIAAWILDLILLAVVAAGVMFLLSSILGYSRYSDQVNDAYTHYEEAYGISFGITREDYDAMTDADRQNWDDAYEALISDDTAMGAYNMTVNLILIMTTGGILVATLLLQLLIPLLLKNGQTVGKKAFALGVIRQDGVKISTLQLFIRTLLGQFTLETMIPVYVILMILWGTIGMIGPAVLCILVVGQLICMGVTKNNAALHDLLAATTVVDLSSQKVFESKEALVEYTKQVHAERAARQDY